VLPPPPEIVVVDYDAGNLRSVRRALEAVGQQPTVTGDPRAVDTAQALVLPGVGSAQDCMRKLRDRGLVEPLRAFAHSGKPFLGVCVGLQLLFDYSEEGGGVECLGLLPGRVVRFPSDGGLKIPQIGWNCITTSRDHPLLAEIADGTYFYFVHSYYAEPLQPELTLATADYGVDFAAIVASDNILATQFHPEKSAGLGLRLYRNFGQIAGNSRVHAYSRG
jgi:imidazole glycerol-phosphate synthase subunit HisH